MRCAELGGVVKRGYDLIKSGGGDDESVSALQDRLSSLEKRYSGKILFRTPPALQYYSSLYTKFPLSCSYMAYQEYMLQPKLVNF